MKKLALFLGVFLLTNIDSVFAETGGGIDSSLAKWILKYNDVTFTSTVLNGMNASPGELLQAQSSSSSQRQILNVVCYNNFNSIAFELGSGTLDVRYDNASGSLLAQFTNAFAESTQDAFAHAYGRDNVALASTTHSIVLHPSADITAGNGTISCRTYYREILLSDI